MTPKTPFLIFTTLAGVLTLSFFAIIQRKIMGLGFVPDPKAFIVPLVYGGTIGLVLGMRQHKIWEDEAELRDTVEKLQKQSLELQATDEMLRQQIEQHLATQKRLVSSEYRLQEQNDELLATEEMLRVQIEEYETSRILLQEANESLQTLFDVSPLAIVISSYPGDVIRDVNQKFSEDFGFLYGDVIGKTGNELGLWGSSNTNAGLLEHISEQQGLLSGYGIEIKDSHDVSRNVLIYSNRIDYKGEKCHLIVYMDITEQKKMENILRQSQKMDVIGQLAGGVAHDFNNMLSAIMSSAELLTTHVKDNPWPMKLVTTIIEAANRSADLTRQLLELSRKEQQTLAPVCMNDTISTVITMLERTIDKNISLESQLLATNAKVNGDQTLLQNALLNLGVNARDAMPGGGKIIFTTANIKLEAEFGRSHGFQISPGMFLEVSVSDTGQGMPKDILEHIFEPFFTTKEIGKGTGLGLATVYGTIKQHNGCISVYSETGNGTVFKLYLPLGDSKGISAFQKEQIIYGSGGILLVDDESLIRTTGQGILENLGYKVYLAADGEEAVARYALEKEHISLVILDMVMPKMGGKETLIQLMSDFPETKVLIASGFNQGGTIDELIRHGARGFIQKPYSKAELCRAVAKAIGDTSRKCEG